MLKISVANISDMLSDRRIYEAAYAEATEARRNRTDRFRMYPDKCRSVAAEKLLRENVAGIENGPDLADMAFTERGKPFFAGRKGIEFNLSHSYERIMCVLADRAVGCDVEYVRQGREGIENRFFCDVEREWIALGVNEEDRTRRFFRIWTLRESFMKATGFGLYLPMKAFEIIFTAGVPTVRYRRDAEESEKNEWTGLGLTEETANEYSLAELDFGDEYCYSYCVRTI